LNYKIESLTTQVKELTNKNNFLRGSSTTTRESDENSVSPSLLAASKSLFDPKDLPTRQVPAFKTIDTRIGSKGKGKGRKDVFVWQNYRQLIDRVRSSLPNIDDETCEACKGNCTPKIIRSIIAGVKNDPEYGYNLADEKKFNEVGPIIEMAAVLRLENLMVPHVLLPQLLKNFLVSNPNSLVIFFVTLRLQVVTENMTTILLVIYRNIKTNYSCG
jgi:hypothetical protein